LGLAIVMGGIGQKLKQPLLIMFLVTGILAGPSGLGIIASYEQIELMADMGIALLLFIVGMRLDLHLIKTTGAVALATGIGQIVFTSAIGFGMALAMGMDALSAAYVAVALTFSSTIIIVKLLSDKKEIDSLHGRIAVGFLIVQDIAAIGALIALTTLGGAVPEGESRALSIILIGVKGVGLLAGIALATKFVILPLLQRFAKSLELLVLFGVAWAVFLGAASDYLEFSKEVGAFLAGISLASTEYRESIGARLTSLRDFLLLFFFIDLGARLEWETVGAQMGNALIFSIFVLVGNPLIVVIIMGILGYRRRTGLLAGLTVAQISEFSLIVAALGLSLGHINPETMGLITLVGVVTICLSTYMILYSDVLYRYLAGPLKIFERKVPYMETGQEPAPDTVYDALLVGVGNYGSGLARHLLERKKKIIAVDFNPSALEVWRARGVPVLYGDMGDPEIHESLPLGRTRWVVSTMRDLTMNITLIRLLRLRDYNGKIAVTAESEDEVKAYRDEGVDAILEPLRDAAEQAVDSLAQAMDVIPLDMDWPIGFREIRIKSLAVWAGRTLASIPLATKEGISVLAVSRAGRVHYEPGSDFRIYPGDRVVLMGPAALLGEAEAVLSEVSVPEESALEADIRFEAAEVLVPPGAEEIGKSLAELKFRDKYGASVVGIARHGQRIFPGPQERLQARDVLVVIGLAENIERFRKQPWL